MNKYLGYLCICSHNSFLMNNYAYISVFMQISQINLRHLKELKKKFSLCIKYNILGKIERYYNL